MVEVSVGDSNSSDWIMNVMQTDAAINPVTLMWCVDLYAM